LKAGLPPDSWLLEGTIVKVFEGEIFQETKPGGDVQRRSDGE
jgi:AMMECR1 domain-containing protein